MALSILAFFLVLGGRKSRYLRSSLVAILCVLGSTVFAGRSLAQSIPSGTKPRPVLSEGEKLLLEMERTLLDAKSRSLRIRIAAELPFLITETPSPAGLLMSYSRVRLMSALEQLDAPTVPDYSRGQFKAVVREKLDGRDALKVEWHTERSVFSGGCMYCPPRKSVVQDKYVVWMDAATKLPLKQVSPNGTVKHYQSK